MVIVIVLIKPDKSFREKQRIWVDRHLEKRFGVSPLSELESILANILRKVYRDNLTSRAPRNTRSCLWSSWTGCTPISFCYRWSYRFPDRPCAAECSPRCRSGCRRDAESTSVCPDRNCAPNSHWCADGARTRDYRIPWLGHWSTLVSSLFPRRACSFGRPYRSPFSNGCQLSREKDRERDRESRPDTPADQTDSKVRPREFSQMQINAAWLISR